jgi:serine/threonine protein phosphatase PrpC
LQLEHADLSLIGDREENQDRVLVVAGKAAVLLIVVDGMGGHADGAQAAQLTVDTVRALFLKQKQPIFDPQGFLHGALARAHAVLVALGADRPLEARPRATCALCLVQDRACFWAHVGDSRIYHLRQGVVRERTRDHSHVELLLQEGVITEDELVDHPLRNFVECCLGGDAWMPGMSVTSHKRLEPGDILLACTDGLWTGLPDEKIARLGVGAESLLAGLRRLGENAVRACGPYSDNTSAAALRLLGTSAG